MDEPERVAGVGDVEGMARIREVVSTTGVIKSCEREAGVHEELEFREIATVQKRAWKRG